jgi:molybdopterin synthase catalytic subunit
MKIPTERVRIQLEDFSVEQEIAEIKSVSKRIGGIVSFLGSARDFSKEREVSQIEFEHYPIMAERTLAKIREEALNTFKIIDVTLIHRVGTICIGENIVLIIVGAAHRQDAFLACAWCIDRLKETVPIWKKETTPEGKIWVEEHP